MCSFLEGFVFKNSILCGVFAGFYLWIGKISGYKYPERLGKIHFWTFFFGVNITFFPMHALGLAGMPRRIPGVKSEIKKIVNELDLFSYCR